LTKNFSETGIFGRFFRRPGLDHSGESSRARHLFKMANRLLAKLTNAANFQSLALTFPMKAFFPWLPRVSFDISTKLAS
jgi:hypothetical protein